MVPWTFSTYNNLFLYIFFGIKASFFAFQRNSDQIFGNQTTTTTKMWNEKWIGIEAENA